MSPWLLAGCTVSPNGHGGPPPGSVTSPPSEECALPDRARGASGTERIPETWAEGSAPLGLNEAPTVGDVDGDGCDEVLAFERVVRRRADEQLVAVRGDAEPGPVAEVLWEADDSTYGLLWADDPVIVPGVGQLAIVTRGGWEQTGAYFPRGISAFGTRAPLPALDPSMAEGSIQGAAGAPVGCSLGGSAALVTVAEWEDIEGSGTVVRVYDAPLTGAIDEGDASAAVTFHSRWPDATRACGDMDGDGDQELVIGGAGDFSVVVLTDPPVGESDLWALPHATIRGDDWSYVGTDVVVEDLDGDGFLDVWTVDRTAGRDQRAIGCRGPFLAGERRDIDDCDWIVVAAPGDVLGEPLVGDFDGDGVQDLAIGTAFAADSEEGRVDVFQGPVSPGTFATAEATLVIRSVEPGPGDPFGVGDRFGSWLRAGQLDGNGIADLVVSAPHSHHDAGSIQLAFGGPAFFP